MSEPAFDELLRRLAGAEAEFVIVGGLALNAWGVVRGTQGEALLGTPFSIAAALASGEQVAIETDLGRLDVVQGLDGVPSFEDLRSRATEAEILGSTVWICSREDLRAMKQAAGRTRDLADIEDLDAAAE